MPLPMQDPDGNDVELVPAGQASIRSNSISASPMKPHFESFMARSMQAERLGPGRFKLGKTVISFRHDPAASARAEDPRRQRGRRYDARVGIRYITVQVRDCDAEHRRLISMGVWEGAPPLTLGTVARISFIRDPDGNAIEISQRASLTGPLPA